MTPRETVLDLPVCPGVSSRGVGGWWPAAGFEGTEYSSTCLQSSKEGHFVFITSTIVWPQVLAGREQQKIGLKTLSTAPPVRTRPSFSLSLSSQEASISFLFHQRADRLKTIITEN